MSTQEISNATSRPGVLGASLRRSASLLTDSLAAVRSAWDKFWFRPREPYTLGVMRWFVGGMLLYTHLVWGIELNRFLGPEGFNSLSALADLQEGMLTPSFWWFVPRDWMLPVHILSLVVLFCFWIGLATRITSVLSMIITVSYCYRAHMANFGLDQINAILCFYLCIGPAGAVLSVDRLLAVWKEKRRAAREGRPARPLPVLPSASANLAVRLMQIHFCLIYAVAGLSKLQGPAWWSGEAIWLAFSNLEYQSMDMTWVAWYPWISELMTHTTIIWEVSFPALIWVRATRPTMLLMGFLLHIGIGAMMGMWTFGLIMIFGHMSFWPRHTTRRIAQFFPSSERLLGLPELPPPQTACARRPSQWRPTLLYVDSVIRRRIDSLAYFLSRGFRCLDTDDPAEAEQVCRATRPDAVVVLGADMPDEEIQEFCDQHYSHDDPRPLFMVVTEEQSERLNGSIHRPNSHVLAGRVSLGQLRRSIQDVIAARGESDLSEEGVSAPLSSDKKVPL